MRICFALLLLLGIAAADETDLRWRSGAPELYAQRRITLKDGETSVGRAYSTRIRLSDRKLLIAYVGDRLWVDRDFDNDLTDERMLRFTYRAPRYDATLDIDMDGRIRLHLYRLFNDPPNELRLMVLAHREGAIALAGRLRRVALFDADGDLRFRSEGETDLYLDLDGDGELDREAERLVMGKPFRLNDRGYLARLVDPDGRRIAMYRLKSAPSATPRRWRGKPVPRAGRRAPGPAGKSVDTLVARDKSLRKRMGEARYRDYLLRQRATALAALGTIGSKDAALYLLNVAQRDKEPSLRAAAVRALGYVDYLDYAPRLNALARGSAQAAVRVAALDALHGMNAERIQVILDLMRSRDDTVSPAAARHLAYLGTDEAHALLAMATKRLPTGPQRRGAYFATTRYRPTAPAPFLVAAAARDSDPRLRALGLRDAFFLALPNTRALAIDALKQQPLPTELRLAAIEVLGSYGDPDSVRALLPLAADATPTVRARLIDMLQPLRDNAAVGVILEQGLGSSESEVRAVTADIVAGNPDLRVPPLLSEALERELDKDALVALVRAVGRQRAPEAARAVIGAARRYPGDPDIQRAAMRALARIGLGFKEVRAYFDRHAASKDWEQRARTIDAAVAGGDPKAAGLLVAALDDDIWQVRIAAVQGLGQLRVKATIPKLITRLETEPMGRVRRALAQTLFVITGRNLYDIADLWWRWWAAEGKGFVVPKEVPQRRKDGPGGERRSVATFYGIPVESDRVIFVIDKSGSMGFGGRIQNQPNKLDRAVEETLKVVGKLRKGARVNVILFDHSYQAWRKGLVKVTKSSKSALKRHLTTKSPSGGTNIYDPLERAVLTKDVDTVYLLSDGQPGSGKFIRMQDIVREIGKVNQLRRIVIHCVSLGGDSGLLRQLAEQSGGSYARR